MCTGKSSTKEESEKNVLHCATYSISKESFKKYIYMLLLGKKEKMHSKDFLPFLNNCCGSFF